MLDAGDLQGMRIQDGGAGGQILQVAFTQFGRDHDLVERG